MTQPPEPRLSIRLGSPVSVVLPPTAKHAPGPQHEMPASWLAARPVGLWAGSAAQLEVVVEEAEATVATPITSEAVNANDPATPASGFSRRCSVLRLNPTPPGARRAPSIPAVSRLAATPRP